MRNGHNQKHDECGYPLEMPSADEHVEGIRARGEDHGRMAVLAMRQPEGT